MTSERDVYTQLIENQESQERLTSRSYKWSSTILPFLFPALGGSLYGYDIGATSGASISLESASLSGTDWYDLSSVQTGLVESGSLYGALIGSILAFTVADFLGRRRELIAAAACYVLGGLIEAVAPNFAVLVVGRLVYGFGIGMAMHGAPMYIAETCPVEIRGTLISMKEAFIVLGMLLGYLVGYLAIGTVGGWRIMYGVAAPIALIMAVGMWWLPPSPRWLLLCACKGKGAMDVAEEAAAASIRRLRGKDIDEHVVSYELQETVQSLQLVREEASLSEIFKGASLKALVIGCGLVLFQQITGQPSVLYYAGAIFQSAGFSAASDATRVSVILGGFKVLMTLIAVWKVDKLGRRPLLIGGVSLLVLSLFLLALYYAFISGASALAVIALLLYVGSYQVSFGPIVWLMISEIFPLRTRGRALSITVLLNFAANALVTFSFSPLEAAIGTAATFLLFGIIGVISLIFVIFKVPETKGLSLEEIEAKFTE
ncbi:hypothetical protein GOP47_0028488 [Adiantum capillus-veneris]|nr:hypothetical protein GOP47_0028488 [Adiantum capillus-veneris]